MGCKLLKDNEYRGAYLSQFVQLKFICVIFSCQFN
jgi:hypothetical protein